MAIRDAMRGFSSSWRVSDVGAALMWDPVVPLDTRLLRRAAAVFAASGKAFESVAALTQWIRRRKVKLFYYQSTSFELVCGFIADPTPQAWKAARIGWRGQYEAAFLREALTTVHDILNTFGVQTAEASMLRTGPSDPMNQVNEMALAIAESMPGIAIQSIDQANRRIYRVSLTQVSPVPAGIGSTR